MATPQSNGQVHAADLAADLQCPVCLEVFEQPAVLACGHTHCLGCINKLPTDASGGKKKCPECRSVIEQSPKVAFATAKIVDIYLAALPLQQRQLELDRRLRSAFEEFQSLRPRVVTLLELGAVGTHDMLAKLVNFGAVGGNADTASIRKEAGWIALALVRSGVKAVAHDLAGATVAHRREAHLDALQVGMAGAHGVGSQVWRGVCIAMINSGATPTHFEQSSGFSTLWPAIESGDEKLCLSYIDAGADSAGAFRNRAFVSLAAEKGMLQLVKRMLEAPDTRVHPDDTAVRDAVWEIWKDTHRPMLDTSLDLSKS